LDEKSMDSGFRDGHLILPVALEVIGLIPVFRLGFIRVMICNHSGTAADGADFLRDQKPAHTFKKGDLSCAITDIAGFMGLHGEFK